MKLIFKPHKTSPDMVEIWTSDTDMWTACHVDILNELDKEVYRAVRTGRTATLILMEVGLHVEAAA